MLFSFFLCSISRIFLVRVELEGIRKKICPRNISLFFLVLSVSWHLLCFGFVCEKSLFFSFSYFFVGYVKVKDLIKSWFMLVAVVVRVLFIRLWFGGSFVHHHYSLFLILLVWWLLLKWLPVCAIINDDDTKCHRFMTENAGRIMRIKLDLQQLTYTSLSLFWNNGTWLASLPWTSIN